MFIWRCLWKAVPVQAVLAARIRSLSPLCKICGQELETVIHTLFHCDFARAAWLASPPGMRTDNLPRDFKEAVLNARQTLSDQDLITFVSMIWAIWRVRNEAVYDAKTQSFITCKEYMLNTQEASKIHYWYNEKMEIPVSGTAADLGLEGSDMAAGTFRCYVDGSWTVSGEAGIGAYLVKGGETVEWVSRSVSAVNATQAEAMAFAEGCNRYASMPMGLER